MKIKHLLTILLVLTLTLCVVACGNPQNLDGEQNKNDAEQNAVPAEYKLEGGKKAIIILPGLLASGLYDSESGRMLWDPFSSETSDDMDLLSVLGAYGDDGLVEFVDAMSLDDMKAGFAYAMDCVKNSPNSVLRRIMCDENGDTDPNVVGVPYSYQGHQRYGALNSYRSIALNLEALYGEEYEVVVFNYNWLGDTRLAAKQLETYMKENNMTESILVAHSMGGIVGTEFLALDIENRARVDKFITLGTPFYGSYSVNSWFDDPLSLRDQAAAALEEIGMTSFLEKFESFYDETVVPMLFNMTSMYQLLPSPELVALLSEEGKAAYTWEGKAISAEELYDLYLSRPWSTLSPTVTVEEAKELAPRKQMTDWVAYRDGFYVTKGEEKVFAADLVDTYYLAGIGVHTAQGVDYSGETSILQHTYDGDGTVPLLSATRGKSIDGEHVFAIEGAEHIILGCYFNGEQAEILQKIIGGEQTQD